MPGVKTIEAPVPGNKCGLIIGKGGETIRQIINQSGAHVELNRNVPENSPTKYFVIRGTDAQIQQAQNIIREKLEDVSIKYEFSIVHILYGLISNIVLLLIEPRWWKRRTW